MRYRSAFTVLLLLMFTLRAHAVEGIQAAVEYGWHDTDADSYHLALVWKPYPSWFRLFGGHVDGMIETGVNYTKYTGGGNVKVDSLTGVSLVGLLRWRARQQDRFFLELGSGPTKLSDSEFGNLNISTSWHFRSVFGFGWTLGDKRQYDLGYRLIHISNAGTNEPNPGLDLMALQLGYNY